MSARIQVFDPALCCPTGICGANVDPELVRIAGDLAWLETHGIDVERANLAQQPDAFVRTPAVLALLNAEDVACLPITIVDGEVVATREYPTRDRLAELVGVTRDE